MRKTILAFALLAAPLHAQGGQQVLPQLSLDKAGSARTVSVRDPVAGANVAIGTLTGGGFVPSSAALPPSLAFSLTGADDPALQTAGRSFPGVSTGQHIGRTRYAAHIGTVFDGSGIAADPTSADYGLAVVAYKKNWLTSTTPGEADGVTIFGRNGIGDFAGTLCNVGTRRGFSACSEGVSSIFQPDGYQHVATRAILASTFYDGTTYGGNGAVFYAEVGTGTAAIDITAKPGAVWADAIHVRTADPNAPNFRLSGDGMRLDLGANASTTDVALRLGVARTDTAPAYIDLSGSPADGASGAGFGLRLLRQGDTSYLLSRTGRLTLEMLDRTGSIGLQVAGANRLLANGAGVGFNGKKPLTAPVLAAALPTDGSATNAQIAAAYNSLRSALIAYGLAQ